METKRICPNCRAPLPPDVPLGLCPECLVKAGLDSGTDPAFAGEGAGSRFVPPPAEEIARLFPHLEILRLIGRGGMGAVYQARQPALDRLVALKVLPPAEAGSAGFAERFNREARALARLNHPNIVAVHDFGKAGSLHYLVMEFVDGTNLREVERAGRLAPEQALAIVPQICEALQFAHNEGIVHRDIKPENILLDMRGRVKITDFGIAKMLGKTAENLSLTGARDVVGTPHYMAPEQVERPQKVDHRADIFSLGVVFYEMLTGELPLGKFAPPSSRMRGVQVDVRLDEVVLHALEKQPERRYQHASEVKTDVETIAKGTPLDATASSEDPTKVSTASPWQFRFNLLVQLLPGERLLASRKWVRGLSAKSSPTYRLFFTVPPLLEAGLYVTDRRVVLISTLLRLLSQEFSVWFPTSSKSENRERLLNASAGQNRFGRYLELISENARDHWYRSRKLRLRCYTRDPESLQQTIAGAQSRSANLEEADPPPQPRGIRPSGQSGAAPARWVGVARWTARLFSLLLLAFYGFFILGEGLPPIAGQPEGVQLGFIALGIMLAGFVAGWKREGTAALLIASGWTLWQVSESQIRWNLFQTPLPVAALYAFCWWGSRGRRTGVVIAAATALALALGLGRLFCPTNVIVQGVIRDAASGAVVPNAELMLLPPRKGGASEADRPNARSAVDGRFRLYVGWYKAGKELRIAAPGYATLATNLGPRALGRREVERDFQLQPQAGAAAWSAAWNMSPDYGDLVLNSPVERSDRKAGSSANDAPPVVVSTIPPSGASDVDPNLAELRVTFSKPMRDRSWSWSTWGEENYPETTGEPQYLADGRTCVLPVKLESGKLYAIWLNSQQFQNFKDRDGRSAVPYLLIFQTRE